MSELHLALCCVVCRKVKDEHWDGAMDHAWCTITEYIKRYLVHAEDVILSDSYCPDCTKSYDRLVQYGRTSQLFTP
jgi:hypothetical protein